MRIPLIEPGTRPQLAEQEAAIIAKRGRVSPLYQALLNSPPMAEGWEKMLTAVRLHNSLAGDVRELMIVRVAVLNGARFEYDAHVPIALREGSTQAKVDAVSDPGRIGEGLTDYERLMIELTDCMTREIEVPDALYRRLRDSCTDQQMVDAVVTVAAYNMVSRFLVAMHIGH